MIELAPKVKDIVKALAWATAGLFVLVIFIVTAMWLWHLVFDYEHFGEFNAKITGRAVYADSASQQVQKLGEKKVEQYKKLQSPTTK